MDANARTQLASDLSDQFPGGKPQDSVSTIPTVDPTLLRRCQSGDQTAFRSVVETLKERAYYHALALTGNHCDAVDVSQTAFARAWKVLASYDPQRPFYPWFSTILRRLALNFLRTRRRRREDPLALDTHWVEPVDPSTPGDLLEARERSRAVQSALSALSPEDREILLLKEWDGLTYRQIADTLGIAMGTVMSRLHHARQRLGQTMKSTYHELS